MLTLTPTAALYDKPTISRTEMLLIDQENPTMTATNLNLKPKPNPNANPNPNPMGLTKTSTLTPTPTEQADTGHRFEAYRSHKINTREVERERLRIQVSTSQHECYPNPVTGRNSKHRNPNPDSNPNPNTNSNPNTVSPHRNRRLDQQTLMSGLEEGVGEMRILQLDLET